MATILRVIHITDTHFAAVSELPPERKRTRLWAISLNLWFTIRDVMTRRLGAKGRLIVSSGTYLRAPIEKFLNWIEKTGSADQSTVPTILVHTGDLAATGSSADVAVAEAHARRLHIRLTSVSDGARAFFQRGNHDVYDVDAFPCKQGAKVLHPKYPAGVAIWPVNIRGVKLAFLMLDFVYRTNASRLQYLSSLSRSLRGEASAHRLSEIEEQLRGLRESGYTTIAMSHFPLGRMHREGAARLRMVPRGAARLRKLLEDNQVPLVLEGHVHKHAKNKRAETWYVTAPSLSSSDVATADGNGFHEILVEQEADAGHLTLRLRRIGVRSDVPQGLVVVEDTLLHSRIPIARAG